jgi:hypothetical protein
MGLSSGGSVVFSSCCSGGGGVGVMAMVSGGGCGGQTSNPVSIDSWSASLAPDLGARVLVGLPRGLIQILATAYMPTSVGS